MCSDVWVSGSEKNEGGKKKTLRERRVAALPILRGGKKRPCFDSFIYLKHLTGRACRHAHARGQCDMSDSSREFPWMDGDELGCPPLSSSGMLTSVEGTGRLWNNSMSRGTWLKDGEWVEMKEMNVKMRVLRDESTGCRYLIATPRRPLSLTPLSGSLYLVISFV